MRNEQVVVGMGWHPVGTSWRMAAVKRQLVPHPRTYQRGSGGWLRIPKGEWNYRINKEK